MYLVSYYLAISRPPEGSGLARALAAENATHGDLRFTAEGVADKDLAQKVWQEIRAAAECADARYWL